MRRKDYERALTSAVVAQVAQACDRMPNVRDLDERRRILSEVDGCSCGRCGAAVPLPVAVYELAWRVVTYTTNTPLGPFEVAEIRCPACCAAPGQEAAR